MAAFLLTVDLVEPASRQELSSLISSTGTWHSCLSCAISYAAGAARSSPALVLILSVFSLHPISIVPLYLSTQRALHFVPFIHFFLPICFLFSYFLIWKSLQLMFSRWALMLLAWIVSLLTLNLALCLFSPLCCRCKEGYHGLRCDQFVPKTDAILSDPSMLPAVILSLFFFFCISLSLGELICSKETNSEQANPACLGQISNNTLFFNSERDKPGLKSFRMNRIWKDCFRISQEHKFCKVLQEPIQA